MADDVIQIVLRSVDEMSADLKRVEASLGSLKKTTASTDNTLKTTNRAVSELSAGFGGMGLASRGAQAAIGLLATAVAGFSIQKLLSGVTETAIALDKIGRFFEIAAGSAAGAAVNMKFVRDEADRLGLPFKDLAEAFGKFSVAADNAGFSTDEVRATFVGFTEALTVMNADAADTRLVFLALEQMVSKGKIAMEELRRQLGERLPGAFQLAAKAVGVTTQQLEQMVSKGQITARELLPKLAAELQRVFGPQVPAAANDLQSGIARLSNAFFSFYKQIGESGALDSFRTALGGVSDLISDPQFVSNIGAIAKALGGLFNFIFQYKDALIVLGAAAAALTGHWYLLGTATVLLISKFSNLGAESEVAGQKLDKLNEAQQKLAPIAGQLAQKLGMTTEKLKEMTKKEIEEAIKSQSKEVQGLAGEYLLLSDRVAIARYEVTQFNFERQIQPLQQQLRAVSDEFHKTANQITGFLKDIPKEELGLTSEDLHDTQSNLDDILEALVAVRKGPRGTPSLDPLITKYASLAGSVRKLQSDLENLSKAQDVYNKAVEKSVKKEGDPVKKAADDDKAKKQEKFIEGLKQQIVQLQTQEKALTEGEEAALRWRLEHDAAAAGLNISSKNVSELINKIVNLSSSLKTTTADMERAKKEFEEFAKRAGGDEFLPEDAIKLSVAEMENLGAQGQRFLISLDSQLNVLSMERDILEESKAGYDALLLNAKNRDAIERQIFSAKVQQKEIEISILDLKLKQLTADGKSGEQVLAQLKLSKAELEALKTQADSIGSNVRKALAQLAVEAKAAAQSTAREFVDRFIEFLTDRQTKLRDVLASFGKTILSDIGEHFLSQMLEGPMAELLRQQKDQGVRPGGGIAGILSGGLISAIQQGLGIKPAADSGTATLATAGVSLNTAGISLQTAAISLSGAAATLGVGGGIGNIIGGGYRDTAGPGSSIIDFLDAEWGKALSAPAEDLGKAASNLDSSAGILAQGGQGILSAAGSFLGGLQGILGLFSGGGGSGGGGLSGILGGIGSIFKFLMPFFGKGGIVTGGGGMLNGALMSSPMVHKFASGGRVMGGPVLGVLGEEGDEIVARMKPAGSSKNGGKSLSTDGIINQNIYIVDQRPKGLTARDVVLTIADDMERNGRTARSTNKILKRAR